MESSRKPEETSHEMKSLLDEMKRQGYSEWGIIDHNGNIVTGHDHPIAAIHSDLWEKLPKKDRGKSVEWAIGKNDQLMVRTSSKEGLVNAMKHWRRMPKHSSVIHDHCDNIGKVHHYGEESRPNHALAKMNGLLNRYQK